MMINNKFNGYSRDGVRLYFDPATIASLATMAEGAGVASSAAAAAVAAKAAAAAAAAATTAVTAPTMLETISGAMKASIYPGAPVAETIASTVPQAVIPGPETIISPNLAGRDPGVEAFKNTAVNPSKSPITSPVNTLTSPEAGAGKLDSLGAGIEKAMKFMMKNATPLSVGMQAISALGGQGQQGQKRSTFKPGYGLSPNFKPTLAPSAPSGVYGSEYNRRMAEGGIASDAEQPSYEDNVSRFAQGGIMHYATGGTTPTASQALALLKAGDKTAAEAMLKASVATAATPATTYPGGISPAAAAAKSNTATSNPVVTNTNTTGGGNPGTAPMTVADLYEDYLGRDTADIDKGGLDYWTSKFGNEVDATELQTFLNAQSTKDEIARLNGTPVITDTTNPDTTTPRDPNVNPLSTNTAGPSGTYAHDMQGNIYNTATGIRVTQEEAKRAAQPAYDIDALYRKYLERNADASGKKTYDPLKYTAQQVSDFLKGSEEYKKQKLDSDEIQNAYRKVLQRDVDPVGASGYLGQNYSVGTFEDALRQSQEYKEEVPFRTMERTIYKPEYEDYTKNPLTSGIATPTTLSYDAIQSQLGHAPTPEEEKAAINVFEANKPTTTDQYIAMVKKGETGMAKGGKVPATPEEKEAALQAKYAKMQGIKSSEESQVDVDELVAYQKRMNEISINTDDDLDTRLLDPYSAAQVRLAKVGKKYKVPIIEMPKTGTNLATMAQGGITQNLGGYSDGGHLLKGPGDGMSDHIPAMIGKRQPARLADGEFVIPADVVSHLGNGSTEAGAEQLYAMMSRIRKARTGNPKQGKQVNPRKLMPK